MYFFSQLVIKKLKAKQLKENSIFCFFFFFKTESYKLSTQELRLFGGVRQVPPPLEMSFGSGNLKIQSSPQLRFSIQDTGGSYFPKRVLIV